MVLQSLTLVCSLLPPPTMNSLKAGWCLLCFRLQEVSSLSLEVHKLRQHGPWLGRRVFLG